jgi:N-acetylglutamate synthase
MLLAPDIAVLDEVIAAAWRAPVVEELDGWQLRYGHGLTGRANSVWARRHEGRLPIGEKIGRAEAFYRERDLRPKVQLSPASEPEGLDGELAERGYARSSDVLIEIARSDPPAAATTTWEVALAAAPDELWLEIWLESRGLPSAASEHALSILCGSEAETVFARAGEVAIGRAVAHAGWAAVGSMATRPEARRRGAARAVLGALTGWAGGRGATPCLNVEVSNEPALALYESAGFEPVYAYWYRTAPA